MSERSPTAQFVGLIVWVAVTFIGAGVAAYASVDSAAFYQQLVRADWMPPGSVFAPVWTTLYVLMAISVWLVWRERNWGPGNFPLSVYLVQLATNAVWPWFFFVWNDGLRAFVGVVYLWLLVALTIGSFHRVKPLAAWLLAPYLAWVTFATLLTWVTWRQNPQLLG